MYKNILTWDKSASREWIASIATATVAYWRMFNYITMRIEATRSGTRIFTLLVYTCKIGRTFRIDRAFWTTVGWSTDVVL